MRRRVAIVLFSASAVAALLYAHVEQVDGGYIISTKNGAVDPVGEVLLAYTRATRDCRTVMKVDRAEILAALAASTHQQKPGGATPLPRAGWKQGEWMLIETDFESREPAILLLQRVASGYKVVSVYGGTAVPFNDVQVIHSHFAQQRSDVPKQLVNCYEPVGPPFDRAS